MTQRTRPDNVLRYCRAMQAPLWFVAIALGVLPLAAQAAPPAAANARLVVETKSKLAALAGGKWSKEARVRVPGGAWSAELEVAPGPALTELEFRAVSKEPRPRRLLLDLSPGHAYRVTPDPCCALAIWDDDSTLRPEARATPACASSQGGKECPAGTVAVPSWIASDPRCGDQHTCVGPIEVAFEVELAALGEGPLQLYVDSVEQPAWTIHRQDASVVVRNTDGQVASTWSEWPWGRETSPVRVELRRGTKILWSRAVQLRHEQRYRIQIPADPSRLSISRR